MKILVAYATRAGSTISVAQKIGHTLRAKGLQVDVQPVRLVDNVEQYDAVIVGSAIRFGGWLPEAVDFLKRNIADLAGKPVVYFTACITLAEDTIENRELVSQYVEPVRQILQPVEEGYFAGSLELQNLSFPVRMLARGIRAPRGDFRDYADMEQWTINLIPLLQGNLELA